ncbi:translation initiation factor IF-2-like [Cygnus olor]|uniref:translation initiation factor IF-2-like n=1 Tax=Cygnus olor TaxID=8869 RepID=UPI001ADE25F3|nr:translation initiation factor IF-2-like [Cygnus olor]
MWVFFISWYFPIKTSQELPQRLRSPQLLIYPISRWKPPELLRQRATPAGVGTRPGPERLRAEAVRRELPSPSSRQRPANNGAALGAGGSEQGAGSTSPPASPGAPGSAFPSPPSFTLCSPHGFTHPPHSPARSAQRAVPREWGGGGDRAGPRPAAPPSLSRAPGQPPGPPLAALTSRCRPARAPAACRPHAVSTTSRRGGSTTDAAPGRCSARLFPSGDGAAHKRPRSIVLLPDPRGPSPSGRERGEEAPGPFPSGGGGVPPPPFPSPSLAASSPRGGPPQEGSGGGSHGKGEREKKHTHAPPRRLDLNNCIILGFNL